MYLNEKAWKIQQENPYIIRDALKRFLDMYSVLAKDFQISRIYVPEGETIYLCSSYSIDKWLSEADPDDRRLFLSFWQKRICYNPDEECEVSLGGEILKGGTEAFLNNSFLLSVCLDQTWEKEYLEVEHFSLAELTSETVSLHNAFCHEQLHKGPITDILKKQKKISVYSYMELWERHQVLFPHLKFCPSVEKNLEKLDKSYLNQVSKKLFELEDVAVESKFNPLLLSKTTLESDVTLEKYKDQHTFTDEENQQYLASWHMRFTGIPGRIFFIPEYKENCILVCYIGKKLRTVSDPT